MALPIETQAKYWSIATVAFAVVLWALGDVLLPFVLGAAIAYMLDPVADRLQKWGLSRGLAVAVITVAMILLFVVVTLAVVPALIEQSVALFNIMPTLFNDLQSFLTSRFPSLMDPDSAANAALTSLGETIREKGSALLNTALSSAASFLNIIVLFVIVPVVAVYMLIDWDNMIARVDELLPRDHAPTIRAIAADIDKVLAGFVRGMGSVCLVLGIYYAVALALVGLQFGLVVGVFAGLLTFIPYVGAILGGGLAVGLALFQFWGDWFWIVVVYAIFQSGQFFEGNVLTPRWVGSSVGLHPVWLLLSLSVFGSLFGFVGLLVAVPLAAALGVVTRFITQQYKAGRLYRGLDSLSPQDTQDDA